MSLSLHIYVITCLAEPQNTSHARNVKAYIVLFGADLPGFLHSRVLLEFGMSESDLWVG
jgi:hypothetical protein